uniref:Uncharacterized protein n=1 Tax=Oryza brachyantha TaxID=4533 RepID=J3MEU2_ORYBR
MKEELSDPKTPSTRTVVSRPSSATTTRSGAPKHHHRRPAVGSEDPEHRRHRIRGSEGHYCHMHLKLLATWGERREDIALGGGGGVGVVEEAAWRGGGVGLGSCGRLMRKWPRRTGRRRGGGGGGSE